MKKRMLGRLFVLLSAGVVLTACATDAPEEIETPVGEVGEEAADGETATDADEITASIAIVVDDEEITELSQEVTVPEGTVLIDVMSEYYDIDASEAGFISRIGDYEQDLDAERYWLSYMDGEMLSVGAAEFELEEGDQIEWRLEDSDF